MQTGTELSRTSNYTSRVDKPLEKKVTIVTQRKPQYLDVALQQAINDEKRSKLKNEKKFVEKVKDKSVAGSKGKSKFESFSGVTGNYTNKDEKSVEGNTKTFGINTEGKNLVEDKTKKVTVLGSPTFQEKAKFKNTQNQKLFQELDQMLSGNQDAQEEIDKNSQMTSRSKKSEKVTVLTKQSFYQPSTKDTKPKKPNYSTVPPLKQNGVVDPESQIFHRRELRAKQRVESIDSLASGDFKTKLATQSRISGDGTSRFNTQRGPYASQGVPVHADVVATRHHYVADIPIYLPSFETANPNTDPSFPGRTNLIDKSFESTIPQPTETNTKIEPEKRFANAPEVIAGPPPELSDLTNDSVEKQGYVNSYRQQANPVRQRLIEEQNRKFEKESLKYFDVESKMSRRSPKPSYHSGRDYDEDETMHSDPGTRRRQPFDDLSRFKYSPEGFLADRERQAKKERETRMHSEFGNRNLPSNLKNDSKGYDSSFQKYSERKEGRRPLPNENSWVKAGRLTPVNTDTYRKIDNYEERKPNRDSTHRIRQDGMSKPEIDHDKDTHRTYQIPSDIRNRDRYNDMGNQDDMHTQPQKNRNYYNLLREERASRRTNNNSGNDTKYPRPMEISRDERFKNNRGSDMRYGSNDRLTDFKDDGDYDRNSREFRQYLEDKFKGERQTIYQDRGSREDKPDRFVVKRNGGGETERLSTDRSNNTLDLNKGYGSHPSTRTFNERDMNSTTGTESKYAKSFYTGNDNGERPKAELKRTVYQDESANRKRKHSAERREIRTETGELKVEYVLRSKSSSTDLNNKDRSSQNQENRLEKEIEKGYQPEHGPQSSQRSFPSTQRDSELSERYENVDSSRENQNGQKPPTYETRILKGNSKHGDDFNKYFDDQENPNSPSNKIPFYSDESSRYAKEKYEFNIPKVMTPVQETSMRHSETSDKQDAGSIIQTAETTKEGKNFNSSYNDDIKDRKPVYEKQTENTQTITSPRQSIFTTTVNKHDIPDDRKSPWRKEETKEERQRQESNSYPVGPDFGDVKVDKKSESFEKIKAEVRQKTEEKLQEKRERTMDSQGPTFDDYKFDYPDFTDKVGAKVEPESSDKTTESSRNLKATTDKQKGSEKHGETKTEGDKTKGVLNKDPTAKAGDKPNDSQDKEIDIDELNLDTVETEMDERELYVCYLMTDSGEAIGPLKLDIDDVQIGLPTPSKEGDKKMEDEAKQKDDTTEDEGMRNRQTGSHGLNEFSSRSHSMLMLTIDSEQQDPDDENLYITKRGKLTFVDLAGSEKVKDSNSTADTLVESNSINKSLLVLGNCISSLGDHKRRQGHIPYRDSKLTKLLADSLGGNGVTLMICCITPSSNHAPETMNTLRYASRAKKIRTKPVIKMDPREKLILSLKREIKVLRNENHYLRQQLEFPAKPRGQLQKENDQKFMKMMKEANGKPAQSNPQNTVVNTHEKLKQNGGSGEEGGLYEMLQEYMVENEALRTENADMQVQRDKIRQEQQMLYRDNEKLMKRVDELERRMNQAQTSWQSMPRQGSYPDQNRSRDHSPLGSPHYVRAGGSGGRGHPPPPQNRLPGYNSPTANGKGKQPPRGQPMKPPHRLNEPIGQQRPIHEQNGPPPTNGPYMNGHPVQYSPGGHPIQYRQPPAVGSPNRTAVDLRMDSRRSSQSSSSDAIKDMNERLKAELMQLEGEIHHHTVMNRNRDIYGSQGSMR